MRILYRWLLWLYPPAFRREFGEEMELVFVEAQGCTGRHGPCAKAIFQVREIFGIVGGAMREHLHASFKIDLRRIPMASIRGRFRFPVAGITFMAISLAVVLTAIRNARSISYSLSGPAYHPDHLSFVQTFGFAFGLTVLCTVIVLAVLYATRRLGVQRLSDAETWPAK